MEAIDLFIEECHNKPLAIVAKLKPVVFEQRPQPNITQQIIFGHNTNALTAASRGFQQLDSMPEERSVFGKFLIEV